MNVLWEHFLPTPTIKFRRPAVGVTGNALSSFKSALIFQKIRDAGCPE
jgi:hypothetical protein